MVMRKMVRRRRAVRKPLLKRRGRKAVGRPSVKRTSDYAKVVEIQETPLLAVNNAAGDSVGAVMNFCLADFQRPQEVAHAYKYYRAAKCEITFIPYYNIAQTSGAVATRLPQLYMSVDRLSNRWIAPTETEMLERGISPKLFTKKRKLVFKPNLLQEISLEASQPPSGGPGLTGITAVGFQNATAVFDKWLPTQQSAGYLSVNPPGGGAVIGENTIVPLGTNPYNLRYHGAVYCPAIEGIGTEGQAVGDIQVKITWEFKGPRALKTNAPVLEPNPYAVSSSQGAAYATPNTQPTTYP